MTLLLLDRLEIADQVVDLRFDLGLGFGTVPLEEDLPPDRHLTAAVGEDAGTLEEVYEPFLIQNGFLMRSPRGRIATNNAYRRFGYAIPVSRQGTPESQVNLFEA